LSTSSTEKWTRIIRKKEANEVKARQATLQASLPSKENMKKFVTTSVPFYPNVLFIGGRVESTPISDDEPTRAGRRTSSAGISPMKEPTPKYSVTS
jgi:hypothetical protein